MNPTKQQIRQLRRDNAGWPAALSPVDRSSWPNDGATNRLKVMRSRDFLMQVYDEGNGLLRLSICRTDWDENAGRWKEHIAWDDLQRLKAEAGYSNQQAIEVFPEDDNVVNVANMRHLWVLPEALPFAWRRISQVENSSATSP